MAIIDGIKAWFLGIALKKAIASAAKLIVSWCMAQGVVIACAPHGIQIDTTNEGVMVVAINSALKLLFSIVKQKWPGKFDWLP